MPEFRLGDREPKKPGKPGLGSKKKRTQKQRVNQHEQDLADKLPGGQRQPNSGALPHAKGDVKLDNFLLDSKETEGGLLNVAAVELTKITRHASEAGKTPGMVLTVKRVPATVPSEWVMIPLTVFAQMVEQGQDDGIS